MLGPIWSILSNAETPFLALFSEIWPPNSPLCLHLFPCQRQGYHNICYVILIFRISIQSHSLKRKSYDTCNVSKWIFQILFGPTTYCPFKNIVNNVLIFTFFECMMTWPNYHTNTCLYVLYAFEYPCKNTNVLSKDWVCTKAEMWKVNKSPLMLVQ